MSINIAPNAGETPDPMKVVHRLAISTVHKINPRLSGIDALAAADELIRFMGAFIGLVGKGVEERGDTHDGWGGYGASDEENARWEAVAHSGASIVVAAEDISLTMVEGPRCRGCGEYGDNGSCIR